LQAKYLPFFNLLKIKNVKQLCSIRHFIGKIPINKFKRRNSLRENGLNINLIWKKWNCQSITKIISLQIFLFKYSSSNILGDELQR